MLQKKVIPKGADVSAEINDLFIKYGDEDYDGEPVSQASHMIQCAMLAMGEGEVELTIGAFLHDIGHLLKHRQETEAMGNFGVVNHEGIGAAYLRERGFSDRICAVVANHVNAKRYLVATDKTYAEKLSPASQETLKWQGGPMTDKEVKAFRNHSFFDDIIKVRLWDEKAKDTQVKMLPLSYFINLIANYLKSRKETE
ncbi:HD domain-containing protein [Segetibacter koreensis]|uniref:HD domain-containing protein n=1 Tax=Segetibacter koreensis TaxID=398037 RepID=UPI000380F294|nr:HDIG domain-containing metalloprotein [Segetibacter koreensis]